MFGLVSSAVVSISVIIYTDYSPNRLLDSAVHTMHSIAGEPAFWLIVERRERHKPRLREKEKKQRNLQIVGRGVFWISTFRSCGQSEIIMPTARYAHQRCIISSHVMRWISHIYSTRLFELNKLRFPNTTFLVDATSPTWKILPSGVNIN
jgi:hypothetical protein